ncbi:multidrug ABC transporter ATP-binding protein [Sedimentitalea sp. CY04]|uniref:Multidrug ABC transporter ATP-binding protein n=1 Tax=Parasedimentitalea denitrificans TaxID=2211118 RepID=A0ABX0W4Z8_9RHOB|nr:ABC transporter ATP-binding protein [Sedimentitalea sp. CY04]NIZ60607.1 multidrug ABC transporter ATP-binding protein [Sedimentitalea sp. CY04]
MFRYFENLVDPYCDYPEQDTPPTRLWPFMRDYCRPFKGIFIWTALMSLVVAAVEIGLIYYMGRMIDYFGEGPQQVWANYGTELILVALFILFIRPALQLLDVVLLSNTILPNIGALIRWRAHKHVLRQSVGWFENDFAGRIANRIMQTPPAAAEVVFQVFDAISYSLAYLVGAAILLMFADVRLILPLLIWFVLYGFLVRWMIKRVGPASKASSDARSAVTGLVVDAYSNIHSVKMFAHHDLELTSSKKVIETTRNTVQAEMRIFTVVDVVLVTLNGLLIIGVVGWAIYLWMIGQASVGVIAAAATLVLRLNAMTGWIMWALNSFFRELGVVAEGMETIAQPIELVDAANAEPLLLNDGEIEIKNLSHHYGRDSGGLDKLNLTIQPGEKIGLIGRSGAGKSSLVKLLLRFYDTEAGQILIDGQDIRAVTQDSLRGNIGMVQQDSSLLHRSVRDNLLYGRPDASEEQMIKAAKQAEAHDFIMDLEDPQGRNGYDAHVGERGVKLSGGQRQRVTLARVILKDAPILLLDEATSALDSEVEAIIQQTLYGMMEGKTVIAIAHRLSTIAQMDRILVLDQGRIVEEGSHVDLLQAQGLYAQFWARQSGGFLNIEAAE